jgi:hypothetical protein
MKVNIVRVQGSGFRVQERRRQQPVISAVVKKIQLAGGREAETPQRGVSAGVVPGDENLSPAKARSFMHSDQ